MRERDRQIHIYINIYYVTADIIIDIEKSMCVMQGCIDGGWRIERRT